MPNLANAPLTFRPAFHCLWCDAAWTTRGPDDLEGWAQLCPTCLGKAGTNGFLRARLRGALAARSAAAAPAPGAARRPAPRAAAPAFPDDWFLRRGAFERGAIHDAAWAAELDMVTRWLDGQPLAGRIDEPAAGVGFFSPLLAEKGELHASDPDGGALDRARDRLVAHRLRAHLHVADPWATPSTRLEAADAVDATAADAHAADAHAAADAGPADALVVGFLLGRVRGAGLDNAAEAFRARLRDGGRLALVDLRPDAAGGPPEGLAWTYHEPALVEAALRRAGFADVDLRSTGRFFLIGSATAR